MIWFGKDAFQNIGCVRSYIMSSNIPVDLKHSQQYTLFSVLRLFFRGAFSPGRLCRRSMQTTTTTRSAHTIAARAYAGEVLCARARMRSTVPYTRMRVVG